MKEEFCSMAYSSPIALSIPKITEAYRLKFTRILGGTPDRYNWRFISKGDFWFHDTREDIDVYTERDLIEIIAIRNREEIM